MHYRSMSAYVDDQIRLVVFSLNVDEAFEPKYGLPIVREKVSYGELLEDIRSKKVKEIHWFSHKEQFHFQGPCLVEYYNNTVKQSIIPASDLRIPAAMLTNSVKGSLLPPIPTDTELNPVLPVDEDTLNIVAKTFPLICLVIVYIAVQFMNWLKGDMADRKKMRQKDREAAEKQKNEEMEEMLESEAESLAKIGMSTKEIIKRLRQSNVQRDLYKVKLIVERVRRKAAEEEVSEEKKREEEAKKQLAERESARNAQCMLDVSLCLESCVQRVVP